MPEPAPSPSYRRLLANRPFFRVFSAGLASTAGQGIASVCLVWIVYARTRSALDVGLLGAAGLLASVAFSLLGGAWSDRYDRRRLMITADLVRAGAMALIALELAQSRFPLAAVLGAYAVVGAFTVVFNPAEQSMIPSIVPGSEVADANGLVSSSRSTLTFVGTGLGGALLVTVGATAGVAINAATFLASALTLLGLPAAPPAGTSVGAPGLLEEIRAGFRWLYHATGFLELTLSATFFNFCRNLVVTFLVVFVALILHASALLFATMLAAEVAGSALGALLVGRTGAVRWAGRAWVVPYGALSAFAVLALVLLPSPPVAIASLFVLGLFGGFAGTAWLTAAQLLVPREMQGRYFGVDNLGSVAILPLATLGGALLIDAYGIRATYLGVGVFYLAAGLVFLLPRALWNLGYRGAGDPAP